ncbi:saccharopine dehydrogenase NADP-binding domain-containing protein [Oleiagrimonas citrea]|uniref:Saccharopine dehydrogenase NADP binding domain-containing protein n=1 Tax=Oleiagrimonas citrea TaxID=1665687 RepID=A0A846ZEF4_9GAMM|nr:saccharopine dehydrogenase NADP-binding domain-containing protein [Oleiagrimonas citrea]NKZ37554.1 hypothetical protein [Oleiagrimonas citrea]
MSYTVLLLGGYGFFGRRLAQRLARIEGLRILVAGRRKMRAAELCEHLRAAFPATRFEPLALDVRAEDLTRALRGTGAQAVVHTCGPFQGQDYRVAKACIEAGIHYVDLADGRAFVCGFGELDDLARSAGVLAVSGASSVPSLSEAAVRACSADMVAVECIDIGISPGNRTERGLATVEAILGYCGVRFDAWTDARAQPVTGWLRPRRFRYPAPIGARWLSDCDVPDLELLPTRFPDVKDVRFRAGLELRVLHFGMVAMAALRRLGLVRDWSRHARWLKWIGDRFRHLGSEDGCMHVEVEGIDAHGRRLRRRWLLVAEQGDGPYVPTLASTALIRKLATGGIDRVGAGPCVNMLELDEILAEAEDLAIRTECAKR